MLGKDPRDEKLRDRISVVDAETVEYWCHFRGILRNDSSRDSRGEQRHGGRAKRRKRERERKSFRDPGKFSPLFIGLLRALRFQRRPVIFPGEFSEKPLQKGTYVERGRCRFPQRSSSGYLYFLPSASLRKPLTPCIFPRRHRSRSSRLRVLVASLFLPYRKMGFAVFKRWRVGALFSHFFFVLFRSTKGITACFHPAPKCASHVHKHVPVA